MKTQKRRNLRRNDHALEQLRMRVQRLYGFRDLAFDRLTDDELSQLDELSRRVVRIETGARLLDAGEVIRMGEERVRAAAFADAMRELGAREPQFQSTSERIADFAATNQRRPTDGERKALIEGKALPTTSLSGTGEVVDFSSLDEQEVEMLEQLSAKLAGKVPSHFADLRAAAKIRALAARVDAPKPRRMPRRDEPGTVVLPAELFADLAAAEYEKDWANPDLLVRMDLPSMAVLVGFLHIFSDPTSPLRDPRRAQFVEDGEWLEVKAGFLPFLREADPDSTITPTRNRIVQLLVQQQWIETQGGSIQSGATWRLRPGPRARELFDSDKAKKPVAA